MNGNLALLNLSPHGQIVYDYSFGSTQINISRVIVTPCPSDPPVFPPDMSLTSHAWCLFILSLIPALVLITPSCLLFAPLLVMYLSASQSCVSQIHHFISVQPMPCCPPLLPFRSLGSLFVCSYVFCVSQILKSIKSHLVSYLIS